MAFGSGGGGGGQLVFRLFERRRARFFSPPDVRRPLSTEARVR